MKMEILENQSRYNILGFVLSLKNRNFRKISESYSYS